MLFLIGITAVLLFALYLGRVELLHTLGLYRAPAIADTPSAWEPADASLDREASLPPPPSGLVEAPPRTPVLEIVDETSPGPDFDGEPEIDVELVDASGSVARITLEELAGALAEEEPAPESQRPTTPQPANVPASQPPPTLRRGKSGKSSLTEHSFACVYAPIPEIPPATDLDEEDDPMSGIRITDRESFERAPAGTPSHPGELVPPEEYAAAPALPGDGLISTGDWPRAI